MSMLFGLLSLTDDEVNSELLGCMMQPLIAMPHQESDQICHQEVGFGRVLRYQTSEDIYDSQPIFDSSSNILFTAQGRIDNREELAIDLNIVDPSQASDSFFMWKAFQKYGKSVQEKLKGDWSLAVYDFHQKELFLSRDTLGYTALYFYQTDRFFSFSTSIKSILALPFFQKELNESYFTSFFSLWNLTSLVEGNETLFKQVFYLKGGCSLTFKNREVKIQSYWPSADRSEIIYKNKQDYSDRMAELIYASVKARLRSHLPVASMLSGGLDSSMVSYIAADVLKQQNTQLATYSHVPLFKEELIVNSRANSRVLDETPYIEALVKASGNIVPTYLNSAHWSPWQGSLAAIEAQDGFIHAAHNAFWLTDIYKTSVQNGFGVLLTGAGGNGSTSFAGIDYLRQANLSRFIRNPKTYIHRQVAKPLVLKFGRHLQVFNTLPSEIRLGYLSESMLTKFNVLEEVQKKEGGYLKYYHHVIELKHHFIQLYQMRSLLGASFGNFHGIQLRDPTTDVDVMNFFLSIPNEVFFDENFNRKMLVKRMMDQRMPKKVLYSQHKGLQGADIAFRMRESKYEILRELDRLKKSSYVKHYIAMEKLDLELRAFFNHSDNAASKQLQLGFKSLHAAEFLKRYFD